MVLLYYDYGTFISALPMKDFHVPYLTTLVPQTVYHWMPIETEGKISCHALYNEWRTGPRTVCDIVV